MRRLFLAEVNRNFWRVDEKRRRAKVERGRSLGDRRDGLGDELPGAAAAEEELQRPALLEGTVAHHHRLPHGRPDLLKQRLQTKLN